MTTTDPRRARARRPLPNSDRHRSSLEGSNQMHADPSVGRVIHAERAARWAAEAEVSRLLDRPPRRPIRQALGRSMVRIGARLAADRSLDAARSR